MDTTPVSPENKVTLDSFVDADSTNLITNGKNYIMKSLKYNIVFVRGDGGYYVDFVYPTNNEVMFTMPAPIVLYFKSVPLVIYLNNQSIAVVSLSKYLI